MDKRVLGEKSFEEISSMLDQLSVFAGRYAEKKNIDAINFAVAVELLKRATIQSFGKELDQSKMQSTNKLIEIAADLFIDLSGSEIRFRSIHKTIDMTPADLDSLLGTSKEGPYN